ncbi:MAG: hypothetical protein WCK89_12050 [bacterium]
MKSQTPFTDIAALEKELAEIAPLVRQGFRQVGGPSLRVGDAIQREARAYAGRKNSRRVWPLYRTVATAAGFALLLGGAVQLNLVYQSSHKSQAIHTVLNIGASQASTEHPVEGPTGLANRLLDIQGLDEEGFFKTEGEEPLWL